MRASPILTSLPLGVDLGTHAVSIVAAGLGVDGFVVHATHTLEVRKTDPGHADRTTAEAVRQIVVGIGRRERRCILAAPSTETIVRSFRVPPGMRRAEARRAAALEVDALVDWPREERLLALDAIPGVDDCMLLSVARASAIEHLVAVARAGGLKPVAVDVAACAWRRAIPDADAVLDCTNDRAELIIFGTPVGVSHHFPPRLIDERLASLVRAAFVEARRDGVADVQHLTILGSRFRYETLEELLRDDGYAIGPVKLGAVESPTWTLAYGLASWSIAPRGIGAP